MVSIMPEILIIDDDRSICRTLELHFKQAGFAVRTGGSLAEGRRLYDQQKPDVLVLDLKLPDGEGITLLRQLNLLQDTPPIIMLTGHQDLEYAIEAMKAGAYDYLIKPPDIDQLDLVVRKAADQSSSQSSNRTQISQEKGSRIVGSSLSIVNLHKQIGVAARSRATLLITGESGSGKELVARAIHQYSSPGNPFVAVNCGAIVPSLIESEFFGHKRGAFTGALEDRIGRLEESADGTIFLDEIGDLPLDMQSKLLRILQEKTFSKVGSNQSIPLKSRVIAATNRDLQFGISAGQFRKDLFYRISPLQITVPPLRERLSDVSELASYMIEVLGKELGSKVTNISENDIKILQKYDWPGNVRELENVILQSLLQSSGEVLNLKFPLTASPGATLNSAPLLRLSEVERQHIALVLKEVKWNLGEACRILAISRPTLRKKIADYHLTQTPPSL